MNLLIQVYKFIAPSALPGADTPQTRFAEKMRIAMDTRKIPESLREVWESIKKQVRLSIHA